MPETKYVHLYDEDNNEIGSFDTIQEALNAAKELEDYEYNSYFIQCNTGYTGEDNKVGDPDSDDPDASIRILGGSVDFHDYKVFLKGEIELGSAATVSNVSYLTTNAGITLDEKAKVDVGEEIYAYGTDDDDGILIGESATMIAGCTIYAAGAIEIKNGAKVFINADAASQAAFTGGIMLGDEDGTDVTMYADGSFINSAGQIQIGSSTEVVVGDSVINKTGKISLGEYASMSAGSSIINSSGAIELGEHAYVTAYYGGIFATGGGITLHDSASMSAETAVHTTGDIEIGSGASMTIGSSGTIQARGTITNYGGILIHPETQIVAQSIDDVYEGDPTTTDDDYTGTITVDVYYYSADYYAPKKIIDLSEKGNTINVELYGDSNDEFKITYDGEDYWLMAKSAPVLYVNSDWTGEYGDAISYNDTTLYYGIDAFSSFLGALSEANTLSNASEGCDVMIQVVKMGTEGLTGDLSYTFDHNLTIAGSGVTLGGENKLSLTTTNWYSKIAIYNTFDYSALTTGSTIELNAESLLKAGSIDNDYSTVEVDASSFVGALTGMKKVIDLETGTVSSLYRTGSNEAAKLFLKNDGARNEYWLTDTVNSTVYVNGAWTGYEYGDKVTNGGYYGYDSTKTINEAVAAVNSGVLLSGEPTSRTIVVNGTSTTEYAAGNFDGIAATINGGSFKGLGGGSHITTVDLVHSTVYGSAGTGTPKKDINLTITDGTFNKIVYGSDRLSGQNNVYRYGSVTMTVDGGHFINNLAGAMAYTPTSDATGGLELFGGVNLTINGGTFDKWVYGGGVSTTKANASHMKINGDVEVTLNAVNTINMLSLAVGSYGGGKINGNTHLTLTGLGSNLTFAEGGEIWGGCTSDFYYTYTDPGTSEKTRKYSTSILLNEDENTPGTKTLSFTGFTGTLNCGKVNAFDLLECDSASQVGILSTVDLKEVKEWSFAYGTVGTGTSGLSGGFANDFKGDTLSLDLTGFSSGSWEVISGGGTNTFKNFDKLASVTLGGEEASNSVNPAIWVSDNYQLTIEDNSMVLFHA